MLNIEKLVEIKNGETLTSSIIVAETFGKRHADVLRAIKNIEIPDGEEEFAERNFAFGSYKDSNNQERPMCLMTRLGWEILVMGFSGKDATAWKIKFARAFDHMAEQLQQVRFAEEQSKHRFIDAFIRDLGPYSKIFPSSFYESLYGLLGWSWYEGKHSHPGYMAHLTNELVYTKVAPGIYEELNKRNPYQSERRRRRWIQTRLLTDEAGKVALKKQIDFVTETARWVASLEQLRQIVELRYSSLFSGSRQLSFLRVKYELVGN